jgi:hypothetical protein
VTLRCDSSVGIATDYGLEGRDSIPGRDKGFFLLHIVPTGSGANTASYPNVRGALLKGAKRPKCGADQSPRPSAEVKNGEAIYLLPRPSSWRGASLFKHRDISFKPQ